MTRIEIENDLLEWISTASPDFAGARDDARFRRLALALFRVQFEACEPYARLCRSLEKAPDTAERVEDIPAVPTGAFKEFALRSFPEASTIKTFRTSGTSLDRRGELHLDTLELYDASLLSSLRHCFLTELTGSAPNMRFLAPDADESPDSSLTYMFDKLLTEEGGERSRFDLVDGEIDYSAFGAAVREAGENDRPLVIGGTSFAFVHFLDHVNEANDPGRWQLPDGSRVMETGGFKGRSRVVPRELLRTDLARVFGLDERHVVNQYGMTELASQFYDSTLIDPIGPRRKIVPPWVRVRFVDPESGLDVDAGEVGMIVIHDLANTGNIAAVQTADLGRAILDDAGTPIGFDVLGREAGAEARGCSIATDVMLEASKRAGETS